MNRSLNDIPSGVIKPGRYADHELNAARKPWDGAGVRVCLAYPDRYEIGMSNLGLGILYSMVNRLDFALADRAYLPAPDMEAVVRERGLTLRGLESGRPLGDFDVLGISLQTELCYTNVLNLLELAGIPRRAAGRSESDPIVLAGGSCCANPEPMSPFFDAMAIGDGEDLISEVCEALRNAKAEKRGARLERLARISGVYVPSVHDPSRDVISARHVDALEPEYAPHPPLVPLVEVTHDRLTVEIARGCTRGCRFCQAGMLYRPARTRGKEDVLRLVGEGLEASGWEEVSLLSLSSSDYPEFPALLDRVNGVCLPQRVAVSVPSLRLDSFDQAMAGCLKRIKRSGLTFAPEAGSQRLRDAINKGLSDEHLFAALELAKRNGWQAVKLYFMIGLPTETGEDLEGIVGLCRRAAGIGLNLKVTISPFVPKPQTPFQWEDQCGLDELEAKVALLTRGLRMPRVQVHWHDPRSSVVEGALARAGREGAELVEGAFEGGARSDQWTEHFRWDAWMVALESAGRGFRSAFGGRPVEDRLPWSHVSYGVSDQFLRAERDKSLRAETTGDCRGHACHLCGADCGTRNAGGGGGVRKAADRGAGQAVEQPTAGGETGMYGRGRRAAAQPSQTAGTRFRVKYSKGAELRHVSHLDVMRLWQRAVRRSGIPVAYSQGFTPHQKISFGPPLPLGMTSRGEYLDLQLERPFSGDIGAAIQGSMNPGIEILGTRRILKETQSLSSWVGASEYEVFCGGIKRHTADSIVAGYERRVREGKHWPISIEKKGQRIECDIIEQIHSVKPLESRKLSIIIKVKDKGAKPQNIVKALLGCEEEDLGSLIERVELFHITGGNLISPYESGDETEFSSRG